MNIGDVHVGIRPGPDGGVTIGPTAESDQRIKGWRDAIDEFDKYLDTNKGRQKAIDQIEGRIKTLESGTEHEQKRAKELKEVLDRLKDGVEIDKSYETEKQEKDRKSNDGKKEDSSKSPQSGE